MLSENSINYLIQPIIDRQESINTFVLNTIASRVGEIGKISPEDLRRLKLLVIFGADIREMNSTLADMSKLQVRDIKGLIKDVAIETHTDAKPLYDYRHKSFVPYDKNIKLQRIVTSIGNQTAQTYTNLSNSKATGFLIRDLKHPSQLKFQSINDTYQTIMDEAIQSVKSGVDYRVAMRKALKQLADSGIRRLYWDSGYTQRLDTAVRRNLLDAVRQIDQGVEDLIGKETGATGKELSAHINSAPDHEPFQGHQFTNKQYARLQSNEDFEDIQGRHFSGVERIIGQWNCRHVARSIIVGVTKPKYTTEQLDKMIEDNAKGYTTPDGKHMTMYECTQMQRQLETKIRYAKDEQMALQAANDIIGARAARKKVVDLLAEYKKFSADCGLRPQLDRARVIGYRAIKIK
jgi:hypothetical protein